jgi:hypothetical protein
MAGTPAIGIATRQRDSPARFLPNRGAAARGWRGHLYTPPGGYSGPPHCPVVANVVAHGPFLLAASWYPAMLQVRRRLYRLPGAQAGSITSLVKRAPRACRALMWKIDWATGSDHPTSGVGCEAAAMIAGQREQRVPMPNRAWWLRPVHHLPEFRHEFRNAVAKPACAVPSAYWRDRRRWGFANSPLALIAAAMISSVARTSERLDDRGKQSGASHLLSPRSPTG